MGNWDRLPGETMVDAARRSINVPSPHHRNTPALMRLLLATGGSFLLPWLTRVRMPDGWRMWPFAAALGLVAGWVAGRQNQWEREGVFDPWASEVPRVVRWRPALSSVGVAAAAAGLLFHLGAVGVGGETVVDAVPPTSTVATTVPSTSSSMPSTSVAATVDAPLGVVEAANTAVAEWLSGQPISNGVDGFVASAPPVFVPTRVVAFPNPGGSSSGWIVTVEASDVDGASLWVWVTVVESDGMWKVASVAPVAGEGG